MSYIMFGECIRVSREDKLWKVESLLAERRGKAVAREWGDVARYASFAHVLPEIVDRAAVDVMRDEAIPARDFINDMKHHLKDVFAYLPVLAEFAAPEIQGRWQALGVEGVPDQFVELTEEHLAAVEAACKDDTDVMEVVDLIRNYRGYTQLANAVTG